MFAVIFTVVKPFHSDMDLVDNLKMLEVLTDSNKMVTQLYESQPSFH